MKICIGNDHGGYYLKKILMGKMESMDIDCVDVGCESAEIVRYPYYAARVAEMIQEGNADRGILICSTGIGMSIIANRFKGIRASLCTDTYMAKMTRRHNDSNVLCLGGKIIGDFEAVDILETWLNEEYEGGRHDISLDLIVQAEEKLCAIQNPMFEELFHREINL